MVYLPRTKWVLRAFGLWPPLGEDRTYEIRQWLNISLVVYIVAGAVSFPFTSMKDPRIPIAEKIESFATLLSLFCLAYNYVCTYYMRYELMRIVDEVENFDAFGRPPDVEKRSKLVDTVSAATIWYSLVGSAVLLLVPIFRIPYCERHKGAYNSGIMCGFVLGFKYPYDISTGIFYHVHLVLEVLVGMTISTKGVCFFGVAMGSFETIVTRLNHLTSKMREVYTDDNIDSQEARLNHCIAYHIHILDLGDHVNKCLALLTIPCMVCYNVIIGISIMAIMSDGGAMTIVLSCGWILALFVGCFYGERLINASTAVGEVAYDLEWYTNTKLRRNLALMILRSQRPIKLKCGSLGELSFATFSKIMQGAYTYATMRSGLDS